MEKLSSLCLNKNIQSLKQHLRMRLLYKSQIQKSKIREKVNQVKN